jgi:hypothetical protein
MWIPTFSDDMHVISKGENYWLMALHSYGNSSSLMQQLLTGQIAERTFV